jgi:hypothetical protein
MSKTGSKEVTVVDEATQEATPKKAIPKDALLVRFIKLSGYRERDVDKINQGRRTVLTTNGGKYVFTKNGLRTLNGPKYPKEVEEE